MLINIQFLRLVAAMLVVFYHTSAHLGSTGVEQGWFFAANDAMGFAGVDVFFLISGFIMAWTSMNAAGLRDAWSFLRRRVARIYSGYWPFFLLALGLFAWVNPALLEQLSWLKNIVLWPVYPLLVAVAWTLIFEMFFYVLFTVIIICTSRKRAAVLFALLILMIVWVIYSQYVRTAYAPGHLEYMTKAEYYALSPYLLEFLVGALVAYWASRPGAGTSASLAWLSLLIGAVLFSMGGWINLNYFGGSIEEGYTVFYRVLLFGTPATLILAGLVRLDQAGIRAPERFSLMAGGASYAIYLSHTLILLALQKLGFNEFAAGFGGLLTQLVYLLLGVSILVYSLVHYRLVERPLHHLFKKVLSLP